MQTIASSTARSWHTRTHARACAHTHTPTHTDNLYRTIVTYAYSMHMTHTHADKLYRTIVARGKWAWDLFLNNDPSCANCGTPQFQ